LALVPPSGSLLDVLPTILKIMGLEIPAGLDGKSLI
jgi:bisphosphoglycerate-independent phosphoglycerate mutase (AlkP superfamily)